MRVLVCGGRNYNNSDRIWSTLTRLNEERGPFTLVIHGGANGVDTQAMIWVDMMASAYQIQHRPFAAYWQLHGKAAGPIRNQRMVDEGKPELVIAFPGGKGTADMVTRAKVAGIEVIEIKA